MRESPSTHAWATVVVCSMRAISTRRFAMSGRPSAVAFDAPRSYRTPALSARSRYSVMNSSRTSRTCARIAPAASARSRTSSRSPPCPMSSVSATTSAPCCSASHRTAASAAALPEYARTIRCIPPAPPARAARPARSLRRIVLQPPGQRAGAARAARDDQNRVVAADGSDHLRQLRAIERDRERLRLARTGSHDDELLHALDAAQELGRRALERGERRLGIARVRARPLICAVAGLLHEAELLDVARDRRLRGLEAALTQAAAQ